MWVRGLKRHLRSPSAAWGVAPYVGAWIETSMVRLMASAFGESHPMWVRGLKRIQLVPTDSPPEVAPYMGAWIETLYP